MKVAILTTDNREQHKKYDCSVPYFGTAPQALLDGFASLPKEVEVHVVSCARASMSSPEKLADNIWFHSLVVPKIGWMTTGYQGCIRAVRRKLKAISPDVVHGQGTERDCAIAAVFSSFPNVLTIHGNMRLVASVDQAKPFSYMWLNAYLERFTLPLSDGVVCISNYTREAVADIAATTWLLPNAVDARFFSVQRNSVSGGESPQLVVIANICHRKNQNEFIKALDGVSKEFAFDVVFLGSGRLTDPYVAEFHQLVEARSWCRWLGFEDRESLISRIANADAVVLPSLEDNCPMAVLEAMATGVPVLAANVGGVPDLIEDGVNGVLFDPTNPQSMATAIREFLIHRTNAMAMAAAAKVDALQRFHPKVIAEKHLEIYREVLARN